MHDALHSVRHVLRHFFGQRITSTGDDVLHLAWSSQLVVSTITARQTMMVRIEFSHVSLVDGAALLTNQRLLSLELTSLLLF
jgi:hypothetical protein